jgi:hypothetical protein
MTSAGNERREQYSKASKPLFSKGSVDEVLLTGSTAGKSLTLFQSIALMITGLGVGLGVGTVLITSELHLESTFDRNYGQLFIGCVFVLWGIAMLLYGFAGAAKLVHKRK